MKEEKRHLYRIDPAKVQQKIYEMYPANSTVRKQMLEDAKKKELERLSSTMGSFPFDFSEVLLNSSIRRGQNHLIMSIFWLIGFGALFSIASTFGTTILELCLLYGLGIICFFKMCKRILLSVHEIMAARKLSKAMTTMMDKLTKIKKQIQP